MKKMLLPQGNGPKHIEGKLITKGMTFQFRARVLSLGCKTAIGRLTYFPYILKAATFVDGCVLFNRYISASVGGRETEWECVETVLCVSHCDKSSHQPMDLLMRGG